MNKNSTLGTLVLTFDFELGWGSVENGLWKIREAEGVYRKLRDVLPVLLRLFDELGIASTWAIVGALNEPSSVPSLDHLPDSYSKMVVEALECADGQTFDGRDLIRLLGNCTSTRFACHSYSHIRFDHSEVTASTIKAEFDNFNKALESYSVSPVMVFPQNIVNYESVVQSEGYKLYREPDFNRTSQLQSLISRYVLTPRAHISYGDQRLLNSRPGSIFFNSGRGVKKWLTPVIGMQAKRGLDYLKDHGGELHVWNHPFNFTETHGLLSNYIGFLTYAAKLRDEGKIRIAYFDEPQV